MTIRKNTKDREAIISRIREKIAAKRKALREDEDEIEETDFNGEDEISEDEPVDNENVEMEKLEAIENTLQAIADELGVETQEEITDEMIEDGDISEEEFEIVESLRRKVKVLRIKEKILRMRIKKKLTEKKVSKRVEEFKKKPTKRVKEEDLNFDEPAEFNGDVDGVLDVNLPNGLDMGDVGQVDLTDEFFEKATLRAKIRREKLAKMRKKAKMSEDSLESEINKGEWPIDTAGDKFAKEGMEADMPEGAESDGEPDVNGVGFNERRDLKFVKRMEEKSKLNFSELMKKGLLG